MLNKNLTLMYFFFLVLTIYSIQICFAQSPDTLWTKIYGDSDTEYGEYAEQTDDDGYIIVSSIDVSENDDIWLIKTDADGDTLWTKTFGTYYYDYASCVHQTSDGGYLIFGDTDSFYPSRWNGWLIKTDEDGDTLWTKVFTGPKYYFIRSGVELPSGNGYVFVGYTKSTAGGAEDIWLVRTDIFGDTVWTRTFGGTERELGFSVLRATDGDLVIAGGTESFSEGDFDAWVIRVSTFGNLIWSKTYGGPERDFTYDIKQTDDGGFILAGHTESFGHANNHTDAWLIRTDYNGDTLWTKTWGGEEHDGAMSVVQTSDGGFVWTGHLTISSSNQDLWVLKTDADGNTLWSKTYGGTFSNIGRSINKNNDGSLIITGDYYSEVTNTRDVWLLNVDPNVSDVEKDEQVPIPETIILKQNFPNPFNPSTTIEFGIPESQFITLAVYNLLGEQVRLIVNENLSAGSYKVDWDAGDLPSGIYIYKLITGEFSSSNKMILMK